MLGRLARVSRNRPAKKRPSAESAFRSRAALIAVAAWWLAVLLAVIAWRLLNASMAADRPRLGQIGTWLVGFAALASVAGWGASIGSILRDRGRVRAGAICLLLVPVLGLIFSWRSVSSTVFDPADPLIALWLVGTFLLLGVGTLLIVLPAHLGTH